MKLEISDERKEISMSGGGIKCMKFHQAHTVEPKKDGWNIFKFIDFLSYMPNSFEADKVTRTTVQDFSKCINIREDNQLIFTIYVTEDLQKILVHMRKWTNWIQANGIYYVNHQRWSLKKSNAHPLIVFGKYFGRVDRAPHHMINAIFQGVFQKPGKGLLPDFINDNLKTDKFRKLINSLPGYVEIIEQNEFANGFMTNHGRSLQGMAWVCSWAEHQLMYETDYIELDTSFKATSPYCYCCVNSIKNNESTTICVVIGTSETSQLYDYAYRSLEKVGISSVLLAKIPVLTDLGAAIMSFCSIRGLKQFLCHKHFIERFGHHILKNWVKRLLDTVTLSQYNIISVQIKAEIEIWISQQSKPENIPEKIVEVQCMLDPANNSRYCKIQQWALWKRVDFHIGRCTNHSESLHRVFNASITRLRNFAVKVTQIARIIIKRYQTRGKVHGRSIKDKFHSLQIKFQDLKAKNVDISSYSLEHCNCGWNEYYTSIFGVEFPCIHEMGNSKYKECPKPILSSPSHYDEANKCEWIFSNEPKQFSRIPFEEKQFALGLKGQSEEELHAIKMHLGKKQTYGKQEFWRVVGELNSMYNINRLDAIDIAMSAFIEYSLNVNDTIENVAMFRISCWIEAEQHKVTSQ